MPPLAFAVVASMLQIELYLDTGAPQMLRLETINSLYVAPVHIVQIQNANFKLRDLF